MDSPASNRLRRGRVSIPGQLYLLTTTVNQREPLFRNFALARLMIEQLRYAERTAMARSMAWVVMPDLSLIHI